MRLKVSNVCQLLDKSKYNLPHTESGLTFTAGTDGSIIVNGTCASTVWANILLFNLNPEHIFLLIGCPGTNVNDVALYTADSITSDSKQWEEGKGSIVTGNWYKNKSNYLIIRILTGYVCNNLIFKPQLFDLTEMYGAGNEPTTVEQFRQDFPNEMYEYSPVCWKKFRRLKYVTETKNLFKFSDTVGTLTGGFGPNVARNFEEDKWYVGLTSNNYYAPNNVNSYSVKDNLITVNAQSLGYGLGRAFKTTAGVSYYFTTTGYFAVGFYNSSCEKISNSIAYHNRGTFATPENCAWFTIVLRPDPVNSDCIYHNSQLELGSTASPYQPYGYLPLNRGKYIANKEPAQLLDKSKFPATTTLNGVTFINNGNGTFTVNGTTTNDTYFTLQGDQLVCTPNKKYLICGGPAIGSWSTFALYVSQMSDKWLADFPDFGNGNVFTGVDNATKFSEVVIFIAKNQTVNNLVFKPQLFDLTAMYGAGNEPTTVEQFRTDYSNELYDYNPYNAITFR